MSQLNIVGALVIAILTGCAGTTPPPDPPAPPPETDEEQVVKAVAAAVEEIEARCEHVQKSDQIPVSCQLDMGGDPARMQLVMADRSAAQQYMHEAESYLIVPFCRLNSLLERPAGVIVALNEEGVMRTGDCATRQYSDWESADPRARQLTAAARACNALEQSPYPVRCSMGILDQQPSLVVRYASGQVSDDDLKAIGQAVGSPFCSAITSSGVNANVYLIADDRQATTYNCATGQVTGRFDVRRPTTPRNTGGSRHPAATQLTQVVYERLPMRAQN